MSKACAVLRQKWRMSSALRGVSFDPAWDRRGHFTWLISTRFAGWGSLVRVWKSSRSNSFNSVLETQLKVVAGWTCVFLCTSIHKNTQRKCFGPGIHSVSVVKTYFKSSTRFKHKRETLPSPPPLQSQVPCVFVMKYKRPDTEDTIHRFLYAGQCLLVMWYTTFTWISGRSTLPKASKSLALFLAITPNKPTQAPIRGRIGGAHLKVPTHWEGQLVLSLIQ